MGDQREVVLSTLAKSFIRNLDNRRYYSTYVDVIRENQLFGAKVCTITLLFSLSKYTQTGFGCWTRVGLGHGRRDRRE